MISPANVFAFESVEACGHVGAAKGRKETALLSDARRGVEHLGPLRISAEQLIEWVADWVARGGRSLGKPTHFESRDGRF